MAASSLGGIVVDPHPLSGARNMAIDEALLERAISHGETWGRLYHWSEPTVSLGYFQKVSKHNLAPELQPLACVRRLSGGGAILHHHEITYSCAFPPGHPLIRIPADAYMALHRAIIAVLNRHGIPAQLRGSVSTSEHEPILCFVRQDPRDLVLFGQKILGSAQRRRRGAVLQHGALLLARSEFTPGIPGIADLMPPSPSEVEGTHQETSAASRPGVSESCRSERGIESIMRDLGKELEILLSRSRVDHWPGEIEILSRQFEKDRYGNPAWTASESV